MTLQDSGIEIHRNHTVAPTRFQIFGERSTGTHIVGRFVMRHLNLKLIHDYGWKHGFPSMPGVAPEHLIIVCFRNAEDWLRSMHTKPWHCSPAMQKLDFSDFIRARWDSVVDREDAFPWTAPGTQMMDLQLDRHPITGKRFRNLVSMRNSKHRAHLGFRNRNVNLLMVRMEAVLADPEGFLQKVSDGFALPDPEPFRPIKQRLGSKFKALVDDRPETPDAITIEDREFLLDQLNLQMEAEIGYTYD
ncbi:hypothetical protein [Actibacterium pelagium]|uniref:Uncharacterized protein n=1 Tax=Actibacterium pelagium TaxID=2029103 RepID=A0A917EI44_9RHOB|nr:hypothetical protein [Actibacterium pelagium]GGE45384.1 hypothetical protein GCM10011517_11230 [Actibacterium pelagium]